MATVKNYGDAPLNELLCGRMPVVSSRRPGTSMAKVRALELPQIRNDAFPPEVVTYRRKEQTARPIKRRKEIPMPKELKYHKIQRDLGVLDNVDRVIQAYDIVTEQRRDFKHKEWEEKYMEPFEGRLRKKMGSKEHDRISRLRTRAATSMQETRVPYLTIKTADLTDRFHNHVKHADTERRLSTLVEKTNGTYKEPIQLKERNTMDVRSWRIMPETRFYTPRSEKLPSKGKKFFDEKYQSRVKQQIGHFPPRN